jgi:hypothetical protein
MGLCVATNVSPCPAPQSGERRNTVTKTLDSLARHITGVGGVTKTNDCYIFLLRVAEKLRDARRASDEQDHDASREWIQRAGMANSSLADDFAHARDYVMRSHAGGLVDD